MGAPGRRRCKRNRRAAELRGAACSPAGALAAQLPAPSSEQLLLLLLLSLFFLLSCLVAPPCNFELLVRAVLVPWGRGEHRSNERRRPALRKTGHEEGVFHEESELQKQGEDGLVLVPTPQRSWVSEQKCRGSRRGSSKPIEANAAIRLQASPIAAEHANLIANRRRSFPCAYRPRR